MFRIRVIGSVSLLILLSALTCSSSPPLSGYLRSPMLCCTRLRLLVLDFPALLEHWPPQSLSLLHAAGFTGTGSVFRCPEVKRTETPKKRAKRAAVPEP